MIFFRRYFLLFWSYMGWFGCVFFARWQLEFETLIFPLIAWSFLLLTQKLSKSVHICLLAFAAIGITFDLLTAKFGLIGFKTETAYLVPIWLVSMWLLFVTVLPNIHSLLKNRIWLSIFLGAVFGPISYLSGESFNVIAMNGNLSILLYSIFWAIYMPSSILVLNRLEIKKQIQRPGK